MEVTRADRKKAEVDRTEAADRLKDQIRGFGRSCDIVIHVADIPSEEDRQQILQVRHELEPGRQSENSGKWRVRARTLCREGNYHVCGTGDAGASVGGRKRRLCIFSLEQLVGGPDPNKVHPQVRLQIGTPLTAYMNPVAKKADHFQGSDGTPFLIAIDAMVLPGAFEFFPRELPEYYTAWPRVSGVLLVHGPALIGIQIGWMWRLIANPCARNPLPNSLLAKVRPGASTKAYDFIAQCGNSH